MFWERDKRVIPSNVVDEILQHRQESPSDWLDLDRQRDECDQMLDPIHWLDLRE
jgi:hypothetical protein